jgi:ABC-type lipoprotein export system ATPase subunit
MVSGNSVLFADEPLKDLSMKEASLVMNAFRAMVNNDKTVVITISELPVKVC